MIDIDRLVTARKIAGYSQAELAKRAGLSQQAIGEIERGKVRSSKAIYKIATALNVSVNYLDPEIPLTGDGVILIPVVGYVGAGAEIFTIDDHEKGAGLEEVPFPLSSNPSGIVALRVRGTSMLPVYKENDLIFYERREDCNFEELTGKDCVVHLSDGRTFLKEIRRNNGDIWLHSHNADPILHPHLVWAAKVKWVQKA